MYYKKWNVEINGVNHVVEYDRTQESAPIIIDGVGRKFKNKIGLSNLHFVDEVLEIDGKEVHLVLRMKFKLELDLAVDGIYLDSGKKYEGLADSKKAKIIFAILGLHPIVVNILRSTSIYGLVGLSMICLCIVFSIISSLRVPKTEFKKNVALGIITLIFEYYIVFTSLL